MTRNPFLQTACLAAALATSACHRTSPNTVTFDLQRPTQGTPVATYSGGVITTEDVNKALAQLPPMVRMRYQNPPAKKEFIERLVILDLLARQAVEEGRNKDPEVVESVKNVLAQRVVKEERDRQGPPVSDEDVQAWYDSHAADFTHPETWRLSTIFLVIPPNDPVKQKAQEAKAAKLLAQAQKLKPDDFIAFGALAKINSDDPSRAMEGDLRALSAAELSARYGPEVAQAAQALKEPGDLSGLVHTKNGVHILKLRTHALQSQTPFADAKGQIRIRLQNDRRNQAYEKFLSDLKTNGNLKVDEAALAKVVVDSNVAPGDAQAHGMMGAPPPGMGPRPMPAAPPPVPQAPPAKP